MASQNQSEIKIKATKNIQISKQQQSAQNETYSLIQLNFPTPEICS